MPASLHVVAAMASRNAIDRWRQRWRKWRAGAAGGARRRRRPVIGQPVAARATPIVAASEHGVRSRETDRSCDFRRRSESSVSMATQQLLMLRWDITQPVSATSSLRQSLWTCFIDSERRRTYKRTAQTAPAVAEETRKVYRRLKLVVACDQTSNRLLSAVITFEMPTFGFSPDNIAYAPLPDGKLSSQNRLLDTLYCGECNTGMHALTF